MQTAASSKINSQSQEVASPPPPPPPPSQESTSVAKSCPLPLATPKDNSNKNEINSATEKFQQLVNAKKSAEQVCQKEAVHENKEKAKILSSKVEGKKIEVSSTGNVPNEKETQLEKPVTEKSQAKSQGNTKANGCVISGICGKCCLKHGTNCLKMPGCNKGTDNNPSPTTRVGLFSNTTSRAPVR